MSGDTLQPPPPSPSKTWHGPPPPAELTDGASSLQLLSQGAEARVWMVTLPAPPESKDDEDDDGGGRRMRTVHVGSGINVPQLLSLSHQPSPLSTQSPTTDTLEPTSAEKFSGPLKLICKERFPKKYRHPQLDASLTKSRTKAEARSLIRCRRADVPCTNVLAIACWSNKPEKDGANGGRTDSNGAGPLTTSSCLFLEYVEGCTVRQYFEQRSGEPNNKTAEGGNVEEPLMKRSRCEEPTPVSAANELQQEERITTVIDSQTLCVAHTIGTLVARMHAAGVIHGDLTTSNVMIRNPPWLCNNGGVGNIEAEASWKPRLVLIDFGLATSTASHANNNYGGKKSKPHKQQHNAEEKAVDLYVLERAFLSTHPESDPLVEEVWRGYRVYFESMDCENVGAGIREGDDSSGLGGENPQVHLAKAVLNRLEQVRMRGRKRECFG